MQSKTLRPFVKARCGERNHEHFSKTEAAKTTSKYSGTVQWTESHKNRLQVIRHPRDEGILVIEVWNLERQHRVQTHNCFIGGTHVDLRKYVGHPDVSVDEKLSIFRDGRSGPAAVCVGYVNVTIRWEPAKREHERIFSTHNLFGNKDDADGRDLWIGSIPQTIVQGTVAAATERVKNMCDKFGETQHVTIRKRGNTDESWALVTFAKAESVEQILESGLTTEDGHVLRVRQADLIIGDGQSGGMLFHMAQHHGLKKLKPGTLHLTVHSAEELTMSKRRIKDLTTFVDYGQMWQMLKYMLFYILAGFVFYGVYMAADGSMDPDDLATLTGGHGDWDPMNAFLFIVTSFTTVGYGNHPSFVSSDPPCEYPGVQTAFTNPSSIFLPFEQPYGASRGTTQSNDENYALPSSCFNGTDPPPADCWVIADDDKIFDFGTLRMYDIVDGVVADEPRTPHNFPGIDEKNCTAEELTNGTEVTSRYINGGRPWVSSRPGGACWARFVDRCEDKHLAPWRNEEKKKTVAKLFTSLFVLVGIGILGSVGGAFGSEISSLMHRICLSSVNVVFNAATEPLGITHVPDKHGNQKDVIVSIIGLGIILWFGTLMYAWVESMKIVDALYFTVVTASTVGFGDYVPLTTAGKAFTLLYVPLSVVMVAAAIERVAQVPLKNRQSALEDHVLSEFGKAISSEDFQQVRRSTGLKDNEDIRPNDFVIAMLLRLGQLDPDVMTKCRRLFSKLDRDCSGTLNDNDIKELLASAPDTSFIDDFTFDTFHHEVITEEKRGTENPLAHK